MKNFIKIMAILACTVAMSAHSFECDYDDPEMECGDGFMHDLYDENGNIIEDNYPTQTQVQQPERPNFDISSRFVSTSGISGTIYTFTALDDTLVLKDITANRGNCPILFPDRGRMFSVLKPPFKMSYGDTIDFVAQRCNPRELVIDVDSTRWTLNL